MDMAEQQSDEVLVEVDGRTLKISNLGKVMYPTTGTTKGEVLNYYARVAPVLLPHLADRAVTRIRWPHGTADMQFFEKNVPNGVPRWIRTVRVPSTGSRGGSGDHIDFPVIEGLADLTYFANLASLELHVHQWVVGRNGQPKNPNRMVIDLDPGHPAGLQECCQVALLVRDELTERELTAEHPKLVLWKMTKSLREGKVFLDWSQNTGAKTTISPYSLRGRDRPYVAAPRTWEEVEEGADEGLGQLEMDDVLARVDEDGDVFSDLLHG
jgi:bifunctional non-homologous end joining protein LigD